jgi:hypothetical protein
MTLTVVIPLAAGMAVSRLREHASAVH